MSDQLTLPEGLTLLPNWISIKEERELIKKINEGKWLNSLSRRVQHYGYLYDYRSTTVNKSLDPIPDWLDPIHDRLIKEEIIVKPFEQLIINEYLPGQGIGKHSDSPVFGNTIISLSLGSPCQMIFKSKISDEEPIKINLQPRTLLMMQGPARYQWTHQIPGTKRDRHGTRISLTFRYLLESDPPT